MKRIILFLTYCIIKKRKQGLSLQKSVAIISKILYNIQNIMKKNFQKSKSETAPEVESGRIIVHHKNSVVGSTIGRVRDLVSAVILGDFGRILNPFTDAEKKELETKIRERFKNIHFQDDLHIYLGASGFGEQYLAQKKSMGKSVGLGSRFAAGWQDFWVNFARSDAYSPSTNTISIFDEKYSTVAHEIGHAIDFNAAEAEHLRETSSQKDKGRYQYLNDERIASNFAMRFMTPEERKKYATDLAAAYGTYQGVTVGGIVDIPIYLAGRISHNPILIIAGLFAPMIGASVGAYSQRIRSLFRRGKDTKNALLDIDTSGQIDTNPYWDGMFSNNSVHESEIRSVQNLTTQIA
jgi:uncharacterized membrane protein